ncbi:MAG: DUF47 family protein [Clostridia bacterium]|nr:DUF47 family protein [Clostridia bacterium]
MAKKQDVYYYDSFANLMEFACQASAFLHETLDNFVNVDLHERMLAVHEIEHSADLLHHQVLAQLAKEFLAPIEREDIVDLLNKIDTVTDTIEEVHRRLYMYNITEIPEEAVVFANLIAQCCELTRSTVDEFRDFRKSKIINEYIVKVNSLEEEGDKVHYQAIRGLSVSGKDPLYIATWYRMYDFLEECCDACEDVTDTINSVMLKNS